MKNPFALVLLFCCCIGGHFSFGQFAQSEHEVDIVPPPITKEDPRFIKRYKNRYGVWLLPAAAKSINGIAVGLFGNDVFCEMPAQTSFAINGLKLQFFTNSFFLPLGYRQLSLSKYYSGYGQDSIVKSEADRLMAFNDHQSITNGIELSAFGSMNSQTNGISVSPWAINKMNMNGLAVNGLWNLIYKTNGISVGALNSSLKVNGIQVGLVNLTIKLKGLQFGLWNRNEKRSLPILNWGF